MRGECVGYPFSVRKMERISLSVWGRAKVNCEWAVQRFPWYQRAKVVGQQWSYSRHDLPVDSVGLQGQGSIYRRYGQRIAKTTFLTFNHLTVLHVIWLQGNTRHEARWLSRVCLVRRRLSWLYLTRATRPVHWHRQRPHTALHQWNHNKPLTEHQHSSSGGRTGNVVFYTSFEGG